MATILGANTLSTGYTIENSVRFADGDNDAFSRTFGDVAFPTIALTSSESFSFCISSLD